MNLSLGFGLDKYRVQNGTLLNQNTEPVATIGTPEVDYKTSTSFAISVLITPESDPVSPVLNFGETTEYSGTPVNATEGEITGETVCNFVVTGLTINTEYHYKIVAGSTETADFTITTPNYLEIGFSESPGSFISGDPSLVASWNTFFELPTRGAEFASVDYDDINFIIKLYHPIPDPEKPSPPPSMMLQNGRFAGCSILTDFNDYLGCVINDTAGLPLEVGLYCFSGVTLNSIFLPGLTFLPNNFFENSVINKCFYAFLNVETVGFDCFKNSTINQIVSFHKVIDANDLSFVGTIFNEDVHFPAFVSLGDWHFQYAVFNEQVYFPVLQTSDLANFKGVTFTKNVVFPVLVTNGIADFSETIFQNGASFPSLLSVNEYTFIDSIIAGKLSMPVIGSLGATTGNDEIFLNVAAQTFELEIPAALMTCNEGAPDGDIVYLQANNTVTIIPV